MIDFMNVGMMIFKQFNSFNRKNNTLHHELQIE